MAKLKLVVQNDPMDRLTVNLHQSVLTRLDLYKQFYEKDLGVNKLEKNYLVEEMLKSVMDQDKDFKVFLSSIEEPGTSNPPPSKPATPGESANPVAQARENPAGAFSDNN